MSRLTICLADINRTGTEIDISPETIFFRERAGKEIEGLYKMIFAMNSKVYRYISKVYKYNRPKYDEDREEFRNFRKKYEIDREKQKESDDTSFREDIRSFVQQVFKLERDLNNSQKGTKTIKHNTLQILPESYQHDSIVQHKIINRSNTPSLENDMSTDPIRQLTLRDILFAILIFDGYNVPITQFINECHEVQNTVFPQEEEI